MAIPNGQAGAGPPALVCPVCGASAERFSRDVVVVDARSLTEGPPQTRPWGRCGRCGAEWEETRG